MGIWDICRHNRPLRVALPPGVCWEGRGKHREIAGLIHLEQVALLEVGRDCVG